MIALITHLSEKTFVDIIWTLKTLPPSFPNLLDPVFFYQQQLVQHNSAISFPLLLIRSLKIESLPGCLIMQIFILLHHTTQVYSWESVLWLSQFNFVLTWDEKGPFSSVDKQWMHLCDLADRDGQIFAQLPLLVKKPSCGCFCQCLGRTWTFSVWNSLHYYPYLWKKWLYF